MVELISKQADIWFKDSIFDKKIAITIWKTESTEPCNRTEKNHGKGQCFDVKDKHHIFNTNEKITKSSPLEFYAKMEFLSK